MHKLTLNTKLTTLNEYIAAERSNRYLGANLKKKNQKKIITMAKSEKFELPKNTKFYVIIEWFNYRQDIDNVEFAQKFIFDGLQEANILQNDNQNFICSPKIHLHKKNRIKKTQFCNVLFFESKEEFLDYFIQNI